MERLIRLRKYYTILQKSMEELSLIISNFIENRLAVNNKVFANFISIINGQSLGMKRIHLESIPPALHLIIEEILSFIQMFQHQD